MEFGPEIKVDGVRPDWLKDDDAWVYKHHSKYARGWQELRAGCVHWETADVIRLPANHPHYNLITHTYTVRPEDEAALLASDPLSRPTPDERAVAPELVARLVELARSVATSPECKISQTVEAQRILAALEPVDPDLIAAREVASASHRGVDYTNGTMDNWPIMVASIASPALGRQLEKEGK